MSGTEDLHAPRTTQRTARNEGRKAVLVANPISGRGKGRRQAQRLAQLLRARGLDVEVRWTAAKGHGETLAAEALDAGATTVIACGGDGTVQEVANALAGTAARMGLLPTGRCNDFARELGLAADVEAAAEVIAKGESRALDLGRAGGRFFCTIAALGFDAAVSRFVDDEMRLPLKGTPAYLYATLRVLLRYRPVEVRMRGDFGMFEGPIFLVANANTSAYGGAIRIAPDARPDDGLLDICVIKPASRLRLLRLLPRAMRGNHGAAPEVEFLRTQRLEITSEQPTEVWADGEPIGHTPILLEAVPQALHVLVPAGLNGV